jgi:hypothetical protein
MSKHGPLQRKTEAKMYAIKMKILRIIYGGENKGQN